MIIQSEDLIGHILAGHRIEQHIGTGGMGTVYSATHLRLGRRVALKILAPALALDQEFATRFRHEGRTIAAIEHPNIVPIYEAGEASLDTGEGPFNYLAMRYISGGSLRHMLTRQGRLSPTHALALLEQAAAGLETAHNRGIIHRDIKSGNLLLEPNETIYQNEHLFIADFGIAKSQFEVPFKTQTGIFMGTPEYMAPEQFQGVSCDQRIDVYALAVVLYEMLAGYVPFQAETPAMVIYNKLSKPAPRLDVRQLGLPSRLNNVVIKGMAPQPQDRYPNTLELVAELRATLTPTTLRKPKSPKPAPNSKTKPYPEAPDRQGWHRSQEAITRPTPKVMQPQSAPRKPKIVALLLSFIVLSVFMLILAAIFSSPTYPQRPMAGEYTMEPVVVLPTEWSKSTFPTEGLSEILAQTRGVFSIIVYEEQFNTWIYEQDPDRLFPAASLIKLPIVLTIYNLAQYGQLNLDMQLSLTQQDVTQGSGNIRNAPIGSSYSIRELCRLMLSDSDNTAGNMLLNLVGFDRVNSFMTQINAQQTQIQRRFLDNEARQSGYENVTSPRDMLLMLQLLNEGGILDESGRAELLTALLQNSDSSKLPALLPPHIKIAHKTGTLPALDNDGVEHDVGILELNGYHYIIIVMSDNLSDNESGRAAIAQTAELIFNYILSIQS